MATREAERTDAETAAKAPDFFWWDRDVFVKGMTELLDRMKADESLVPCMRIERTPDGPQVWHYTLAAGKAERGDGDGGFDLSHPCPPWCPPGYP